MFIAERAEAHARPRAIASPARTRCGGRIARRAILGNGAARDALQTHEALVEGRSESERRLATGLRLRTQALRARPKYFARRLLFSGWEPNPPRVDPRRTA